MAKYKTYDKPQTRMTLVMPSLTLKKFDETVKMLDDKGITPKATLQGCIIVAMQDFIEKYRGVK